MKTVRARTLLASITWLVFASLVTGADETLERVKALYQSAEYEEALAVLDEMPNDSSSEMPMEASEYRLLCLIALDRRTEAHDAVTAMVNADPFYQLSQTSPRVLTMFNEVRQTLLPGIVQRAYADAKLAYDREDPKASAQFERVITLLNDPAIAATPTLADLRTVASAFLDLSKARAKQPEPPPPVAPAPPVAAVIEKPAAPAAPVVYRDGEPELVPPEVVNQALPPWSMPTNLARRRWQGVLEVLIDENGDVLSAKLRQSFHPEYDVQLIKAAMAWKYRPARKAGVPVRYLKAVNVVLDDSSRTQF